MKTMNTTDSSAPLRPITLFDIKGMRFIENEDNPTGEGGKTEDEDKTKKAPEATPAPEADKEKSGDEKPKPEDSKKDEPKPEPEKDEDLGEASDEEVEAFLNERPENMRAVKKIRNRLKTTERKNKELATEVETLKKNAIDAKVLEAKDKAISERDAELVKLREENTGFKTEQITSAKKKALSEAGLDEKLIKMLSGSTEEDWKDDIELLKETHGSSQSPRKPSPRPGSKSDDAKPETKGIYRNLKFK